MNLYCNNCGKELGGLNFGLIIKDDESFVYCNDCFNKRNKEDGGNKNE